MENRIFKILIVLTFLALSSACSSAPKKPGPLPRGEIPALPVPDSSPAPGVPLGPPEPYGPEPIAMRPITLIFGPGLARAQAHAGVLAALAEAKIPIAEQIGTELGACLAVLYSLSGSANEFEWNLMKLKPELFMSSGLFGLLGKTSDGKQLSSVLGQIYGKKDLADGRIPTQVLYQSQLSGALGMSDRGLALTWVRAALGVPGFLSSTDPGNGAGPSLSSGGKSGGALAQEYRGPKVYVDVMEEELSAQEAKKMDSKLIAYLRSARIASRQESAKADVVIRPNLKGVGFLEFNKKTETIFQGKAAARAKLGEIRSIVGMPQ